MRFKEEISSELPSLTLSVKKQTPTLGQVEHTGLFIMERKTLFYNIDRNFPSLATILLLESPLIDFQNVLLSLLVNQREETGG